MSRFFKANCHGNDVVLCEGPDWPAIMSMAQAAGENRFVRFALYHGRLIAGPGNLVTHGAICEAYRQISNNPDSLRCAALGSIHINHEDQIVIDLQFTKIEALGLDMADQTIKLESAFRKLFRGCNRPLAWVKRECGWGQEVEIIQDDPTTLVDVPKLMPRTLDDAEIAVVNHYWERILVTPHAMVTLECELAAGADIVDERTQRLLDDGFLRWQLCHGRGPARPSAQRIFPGPHAITMRYLLRIRPEKVYEDPSIDVG
jgi:hypothetical protein